jgi:hypothetical protein
MPITLLSMGRRLLVLVLAMVVTFGLTSAPRAVAAPPEQRRALTNLEHLNFLLDEVSPGPVPGHTTYRLTSEPELVMPWTYADARPGGTFERVGGGQFDPATGDWGQGAFNADDTTRAAVVYLRHWRQTGERASRRTAYELLRSVAYHQTISGPNAGNVVLWMQPDGELNPSPEPVELPDPSDSDASYWLARTIWALGEGYAAFRGSDPVFARFLQARLQLAVRAVERQVLDSYPRYRIADGRRVPSWLIVNGADATAEAVLGLAAYVDAAPGDRSARRALRQLSEGIAAMSRGHRDSWPYDAILPWAKSPSLWHAWASQMSAALAGASDVLRERSLLRPAVREAENFEPTLITSTGPDNGWLPAPIDKVQIAYGVDSRVQSLVAVAAATGSARTERLAGITAGWFFGANLAGEPTYNPDTGVTFDGVQPDGSVNRNSGAESTIHGLLSMLALDENRRIRRIAKNTTSIVRRDGLRVIEGESATGGGAVVTPASAWTGEAQFSGGKYLRLPRGQRASIALPNTGQPWVVEAVVWTPEFGRNVTRWSAGGRALGTVTHRVGAQGISEAPGALLPRTLGRVIPAGTTRLDVLAVQGEIWLDALLVRPVTSRAVFDGPDGRTTVVHRVR